MCFQIELLRVVSRVGSLLAMLFVLDVRVPRQQRAEDDDDDHCDYYDGNDHSGHDVIVPRTRSRQARYQRLNKRLVGRGRVMYIGLGTLSSS